MARAGEIPDGGRKIVEIAGRSIGVFHVSGRYFAVRNACPHQGGPLCLGRTTALVTSDRPGDYVVEREGEILKCPWHGWEFDMETGRSVCDPDGTRVSAWKVELVAETYPVEQERGMLVVVMGAPRPDPTAP